MKSKCNVNVNYLLKPKAFDVINSFQEFIKKFSALSYSFLSPFIIMYLD